MLVQETFVNRTEGYMIGESEPYEPYTDNVGRLFIDFMREYGRCTGKVYVDINVGREDEKAIPIGWVFVKRVKYQDCADTYLQETWVTLYTSYEKKTVVTADYHALN